MLVQRRRGYCVKPRGESTVHTVDHWLRTIRPGRRTNSSSLDARDSGQFGTIDYQSFYRGPQSSRCAHARSKKVEPGVRGPDQASGMYNGRERGRRVYPPPQQSVRRLSTFPDGRFQCPAATHAAIGIKWLSGFIMMGPARSLNFIECPGNSIHRTVIYRGVHFRAVYRAVWDLSQLPFGDVTSTRWITRWCFNLNLEIYRLLSGWSNVLDFV